MLTRDGVEAILPTLKGKYRLKHQLLRARAVVGCTDCDADEPSLTLTQVLRHHFPPLGIACFYGLMISHFTDKFTVPVGAEAEIDTAAGVIRLLEPAVV